MLISGLVFQIVTGLVFRILRYGSLVGLELINQTSPANQIKSVNIALSLEGFRSVHPPCMGKAEEDGHYSNGAQNICPMTGNVLVLLFKNILNSKALITIRFTPRLSNGYAFPTYFRGLLEIDRPNNVIRRALPSLYLEKLTTVARRQVGSHLYPKLRNMA